LKALRYIEKYKHLYKSQNQSDKYKIMGMTKQEAQDTERAKSKIDRRQVKGKFEIANPKQSSYANPQYKAG
jgi:hypothetical protein